MLRILFALLALLPLSLSAQSYPDYSSTTVNDFANLLSPQAETRLDTKLKALKTETGVEMTVLTLNSRAEFAPNMSLEQFATGLFNHWGIGNKKTNTGVLVLILRQDRDIRIELGAAFERDWDRASARAINRSFLPAFKEDRYEKGIETGVDDTIETVVRPFLAGDDAPSDSSAFAWVMTALIIAGASAMRFKDQFVRLKRCPNCGARQLTRHRRVLRPASKKTSGDGEVETRCASCSYHSVYPYTISRISSSSSSFGGGRSGGGGASGSW